MQHQRDDLSELERVTLRNWSVLCNDDFLIKTIHITSLEWRSKSGHFINDTSQGPYITLEVVRTVFPDFWARIVRRACLGMQEAFLVVDHLRNVEVSQLALTCGTDQNIGAFNIAMHYVEVMQGFQAAKALD